MDTTPKYYVCSHCGNVVEMLHESGVKVVCCGEPMQQMTANTTDAAQEKHVPVYTQEGNTYTVQVGSVPHPMLQEHYIGWVWMQTNLGGQRRKLQPGQEPKAVFTLAPDEKAIAFYEWCNIHGLWKAEVK